MRSTTPRVSVAHSLVLTRVPCRCNAQVLLVMLLSCFSWELAPRMGGPKGVESSVVAALELRVAQGMWLSPTPRTHAHML